MKPLAIDLFCGLGGWTEGLLAEGYYVVGFDIERHRYPRMVRPDGELAQKCPVGGSPRNAEGKSVFKDRPCHLRDTMKNAMMIEGEWDEYPAQLVIQDVLTLHGSQFKDAALIVASPPCQEYSYMAMPWSRAKAIAAEYRSGARDVKKLTALFDACFRLQREAIEAAGHFIPLVVENVRGACPWVGRSRWNFGSFHLWGDVPALMPMVAKARKMQGGLHLDQYEKTGKGLSDWTMKAVKVPGFRFDGSGRSFQTAAVEGQKTSGHVNKRDGHGHTRHLTNQRESDAVKNGGDWFNAAEPSLQRRHGSKSTARKAASAAIAKIPLTLSQHIARAWKPMQEAA